MTPDSMKYDPEKEEWEGWMFVGEVPKTEEEYRPAGEEYVRMSPNGI